MSITRNDPSAIFNRIVEHNGIVYLAGLTADDTSQPIKAQTENVLAKHGRRQNCELFAT